MVTTETITTLSSWFPTDVIDSKHLEFAWVGQAGFIFKTQDIRVGIDLYLSDSLAKKYKGKEFPHIRMMESPIKAEQLQDLDVVLCTHGHTDHMDKESLEPLFSNGKGPLLIAPRNEAEKLLGMEIPPQKLVLLSEGESFSLGKQFTVHALASAHDQLVYDKYGNTKALGFILDFDGIKLYHSGDTVLYPNLVERVKAFKPELCFLPVNGRDPYLTANGVIGNLTIEEAGQMAKDAQASVFIPHHFGLFDFNTVPVEDIQQKLTAQGWEEGVSLFVPKTGIIFKYTGMGGNHA